MSNIFNKALIASAVLVASAGLAYANGGTYAPEPVVAGPVHNCYVGVAVSRDFAHFKREDFGRFDVTDPDGDVISIASSRSFDLGNDGWNGQIYAGYGATFQDHYYLAAEIFGDIDSVKANFDEAFAATDAAGNTGVVGVSGEAKLRYQYGIDLVPGVKVSDSTMLFGKIGWIRGKFRSGVTGGAFIVSQATGILANPNVVVLRGFDVSQDHTSNGIQLGIGLETMITNNCSAKIEYDWNRYSNTFGVSHPTVDEALLGVAYHFASA